MSEETKAALGIDARTNKFSHDGTVMIYPASAIEKLEFFIKAYRFLSTFLTKPEHREKLRTYLNQFRDLYPIAEELFEKTKSTVSYSKHRREKRVFQFVVQNEDRINHLIDTVFPLGRVTKDYDPNQSQGYS